MARAGPEAPRPTPLDPKVAAKTTDGGARPPRSGGPAPVGGSVRGDPGRFPFPRVRDMAGIMTAPDASPRPDRPLFVVGDLHGCHDLMLRAMEQIDGESARLGADASGVVFLGDYVDRGEQSRQVLEELMAVQAALPDQVTCLTGNHEKMLLDFLDRPAERGRRFLRYGGLQTLASFGVGGVSERASPAQIETAATRLRETMPEGMEAWIRALPYWTRSGDLVCVHAAMDPAIAPEHQENRSMIWGHPYFYEVPRPDGLWVAYGHDVVERPVIRERRISCDTGAYHSGRLTTAVIAPDEPVRFLTA